MVDSVSQEETVPNLEDWGKGINRDRIVVLGRRSAGKTVYLSLLYDRLWRADGDLSMKALEGVHHTEFIKTAAELRQGKWPPATQNISQSFVEVKYGGHDKLMVVLDYPGELFTNAFVKEAQSEEIRVLLDHIDHAEALILLVDPAQVVGEDIDAIIDNDFGIVQALSRVRNWAEGNTIPVVLVFTKFDEGRHILKKHGGASAFVKKFFPRLVAVASTLRICKVSAVQVCRDENGKAVPRKEFAPVNLENPLVYCLKVIKDHDEVKDRAKKQKEYARLVEQIELKTKTQYVLLLIGLFLLFLALVALVIEILPHSTWRNILDNLF